MDLRAEPRIDDVVVKRIPVASDLEVHVKVTVIDGTREVVQIRQFYPSTQTYGRGALVPLAFVDELIEGLMEVRRS